MKAFNWSPNKYDVLCSQHFEANCFIKHFNRSILKVGSVPTIFVGNFIAPYTGSECTSRVQSVQETAPSCSDTNYSSPSTSFGLKRKLIMENNVPGEDVISSSEDGKVETTHSSMEQGQDRSTERRSLDSLFFVPISLRQIKREIFTTIDHEIQNDALNVSPTELNNAVETERNVREEEIKDEPTSYKELESDYVENIKKENSDINYVNNETLAVEDNVIYAERERVASLNVDVRIEEIKTEIEEVDDEESAAAAPAERCQETHAENIQDGSTLTPGGTDILEEPRAIVEEASRNVGRYVLQSTKKANDRHVSRTSSTYADIAINEKDTSVDNDRTSTNTDVDINLRRMFVCDDCGNIFDNKYLLIEHVERHITVKKTSCRNSLPQRTILRKQMVSRTGVVNKHTETHGGDKLTKCEICQRRFTTNSKLNRHLLTHTGIKAFECEICKVRFSLKGSLKIHLRVHTKEKPYECEICKGKFSDKSNLKVHFRIHTKEKPFECEICKVRFSQKSSLKTHLRIHTKEKPYECEICKVRFSRKGSLNTHLRIHTKEKPYECEICKVRFSRKGNLKVHLKIHSKEKPYECEICKVRFSQKSILKTHLRIHTKEKPYECEICKVRFSVKGSLNTHLIIHTKEKPYECEICKVRFSRKGSLKIHLRVHTKETPYECEVCKVRFSWKGNLNVHLKNHNKEKPYECEICKVKHKKETT